MNKKIVTDEIFLKIPCQRAILPEDLSLINILEKELKICEKNGTPGIGLAANQIGIQKHVAIIRIKEIEINLVNPVIEKGYDKILFDGEGCLSFPGRSERTFRYNEIHVKNDTEPYHFVAVGLLAVAIQHEIDHLNGILFFEQAIPK